MGAEGRREARRLEKMRITDAVGKRPEDTTLGDLISLFKQLAGKLLIRCFYEHLRREAEREAETKMREKAEAGEEEK
jgi:hypothetical protein